MTSKGFQRCFPVTQKWEGGWSNHKADPGGATMYGVIQTVYNAYRKSKDLAQQSVRNITRAEATEIFYKNYWLKAGCDKLKPGVDMATFDGSVNSGVSRGRRWLLASLSSSDDHVQTIKNICAKRLGFVQSLRIWKTFGKGWARRIADVQAKSVGMYLAAYGPYRKDSNFRPERVLKLEAHAQSKKALSKKGGGITATGTTGAGSADVAINPEHAEQIGGMLLTSVIAAGILIAVWLFWRASIHRAQADAYEREAGVVS